jgi:hypothetical protein
MVRLNISKIRNIQISYLLHPKSNLGKQNMYINHLDEPHAMMEQNWSYEKFQILELSDRHGLSILVINICQPIFFGKLVSKEHLF